MGDTSSACRRCGDRSGLCSHDEEFNMSDTMDPRQADPDKFARELEKKLKQMELDKKIDDDIKLDRERRSMSKARSKSVLLIEWPDGKDQYRLIAKADATAGYEDEYVIEKLSQDALGEPRWDRHHGWRAKSEMALTMLVGAIKHILGEGRR